jgi:hypothetical protein
MLLGRVTNKVIPFLILSLLPIKSAFSFEVEIVGSLSKTLHHNSVVSAKGAKATPAVNKTIKFLKVELSQETRAHLQRAAQELQTQGQKTARPTADYAAALPSSIQLGMNNVPVLDQGMHGTCTTFAVTASLDAAIGKGDYISQLCYLQLGNYLERHGYGSSGWNGASVTGVTRNMNQYGVVNLANQKTKGCGGLTQYPTYSSSTPKTYIEPEKYATMNEFGVWQSR